MIDRICISINNRCNLKCRYCHFAEKKQHITSVSMNVFKILDNVDAYIRKYELELFKIGFVGNGETLLDFDLLKEYILYIKNDAVQIYTITNGMCVDSSKLLFLSEHNVNIGFSIDGIKSVHDKLRCGSFDSVMKAVELYKSINGCYPSMNCTVGREVLDHAEETIAFFKRFDSRITFSRMIGKYGIGMGEFRNFIDLASENLDVRIGGYDCTMYGGKCGAGMNNYFFANQKIYICGNCVDLPISFAYDTPLDQVDFQIKSFDRNCCFKETRTL